MAVPARASWMPAGIFGELSDALALAMKGGLAPVERSSKLSPMILEHLEQLWVKSDAGFWEVRGRAQHFTLSKVMAWVAFDRAASNKSLTTHRTDRYRYRMLADKIHASICKDGIDPQS